MTRQTILQAPRPRAHGRRPARATPRLALVLLACRSRVRRSGRPEATARRVGRGDPASGPGGAGRSGSTCSTIGARPSRPHREIAHVGRRRARGSTRSAGTRRRSRAATSEPASGARRRAASPTASRVDRVEDGRGAGRASSTTPSCDEPSRRHLAARRRAARAHRHDARSRPGSTGATARPGSTSPSSRRARPKSTVGSRAQARLTDASRRPSG